MSLHRGFVVRVKDPLTRPAADLSPRGEVEEDELIPSPLGERVPEGRLRGASVEDVACMQTNRSALSYKPACDSFWPA